MTSASEAIPVPVPAGVTIFAGAAVTLRLNQDCLDIVLEYAVSSTEHLRRLRTVSRSFHDAVLNLIAYQLKRRRLTGPPPHPAGASVCQRGIDGMRLQLPVSHDTDVLRHVIGIAGPLVDRFDPRAWVCFRGPDAVAASARLDAAVRRLPHLNSLEVNASESALPEFLPKLPAPHLVTCLGITGVCGAGLPHLREVAELCPGLETLQVFNLVGLPNGGARSLGSASDAAGDDDELDPCVAVRDAGAPVLPKLRKLVVTASSSNVPYLRGCDIAGAFMAPALVDVQLPFAAVTPAVRRRILAIPTLRQIRNTASAPWHLEFPAQMLPKGAESLADLEVLYGFTLTRDALPHLTSLRTVGLRVPAAVWYSADAKAVDKAAVAEYATALAAACRGSLKALVLDVNRPVVSDMVPLLVAPFANDDAHPRESVLSAIHVHDFEHRDGAGDDQVGPPPPMRFSALLFGPHRFPKLRVVRTKYTPWAFATATADSVSDSVGGSSTAADSEAVAATEIDEVSLRPPVSIGDLDILGAFAGRTLKYLDVETDYNSGEAPLAEPGLADVLARHFTPALESFTSPQCNAAGWACSQHKRLRWISVSVPASALVALVVEAAQCPLLERLRVRQADPGDTGMLGLNTFTAGVDGVPMDVLSAPFGRHRCPRLVGVNGIADCDPPRPGGEFVRRSGGVLWELASFG